MVKQCFLFCVGQTMFCFIYSQSLINLLVTGHAVSNVWDGDRECSGMSKIYIFTYSIVKHRFSLLLQITTWWQHSL